jgi:hypothetical protein
MNKPLLGLLLGAVLGGIDGSFAPVWQPDDPVVRDGIMGIIIGSTFKGLVAGLATGFFARKVNKLGPTIIFGALIACLFAYLVAAMQGKYYLDIMLPGTIIGAFVGFVAQKYGLAPSKPAAA